ncbi:AMP-binding protein [Pseudonocardia sp. 73-21]|uniref:AMP-binding protein n=1 Tax=Pseudonocardia sp. 73-21 TaxID=1895809 RepID=UPI0009626706|nr:AMP-binding protein [Pseudonocardia sp. 73-21]OJY39831.1 MAG: AMP-dependent synthetase [Pseudonocardia sp. 73-21]
MPALTESYRPADEELPLLEETVAGMLRRAASEVPDRVALVDAVADPTLRRSWTYAELLADAERIARALLSRFGPGERVAIWAPNCAEWLVVQHGVSLAGMVLVPVNPAYRQAELEYVLTQSRAAVLLHADAYRGFDMAAAVEAARGGAPALRQTVSLSDWDAYLGSGDPAAALPEITPDDHLQIQYTSGTTGFPRGALLHHRGIVNASRFVFLRADASDGAVCINSMPMFHIGGGAVTGIGTLSQRGTYVLMPGFEPGLQLELTETYRGTVMLLVPTMLIAVLDHPERASRDLSSIETVLSGASFVPAELVRRTQETLDCRFSILFGQTEMHGVIAQTGTDDSPEDQSATIGRPLPQAEVRIADPVTGETMPLGESGEICVRGYQTMHSYFELPEATAEAITPDGWLHSGDLGAMDDRGFLTITGRLKDMIIRGGVNIYPREIEDTLLAHPKVAETAVLGIPHPTWGETVNAAIRPVDPADPPTPDELRAFCRERMAAFKTPAGWFLVDALPATPTGKIQKFVLRDRIEGGELTPTPLADQATAARLG